MNDKQYFIIINKIRYNLSYDSNEKIIIKNSLNNQILKSSSIKYHNSDNSIRKISDVELTDIKVISMEYKIIDESINKSITEEESNKSNFSIYILIMIIMLILIIILLILILI